MKMRSLHAFGMLARKPRWHTSSWHVNYSFKLSLKLKVKTVKFNKKKEIKSHNSVYFSSYQYQRIVPIKTAEHLPSLVSQKPKWKWPKKDFF